MTWSISRSSCKVQRLMKWVVKSFLAAFLALVGFNSRWLTTYRKSLK
ncbi:unnamed protein product [Spirodela intermedia]|uniref:Uncharacterized protein n=1 Tax=Spirodela intermedia TaxID=51605 RepID=A0ABN7EB88_SPIIN|nr:unnamed protein product [Spirodela intermedia]